MREVIIHCVTKKLWGDVIKKIKKDYPEITDINSYIDCWSFANDCLRINVKTNDINYCSRDYYERDSRYKNIKIIPAREFLSNECSMTYNPLEYIRLQQLEVMQNMYRPVFYPQGFSNSRITKHKQNKLMSVINNVFKSKENKALEHFGLGSTTGLNENGRNEFIDFLFETSKEKKKAFLNKIVEAHKEATK